MSEQAELSRNAETRGLVLTKACLRAAARLGLSDDELGAVLGLGGAEFEDLRRGAICLEDGSPAFHHAALLVRLFRNLDAIVGGEEHVARIWMRRPNTMLGNTPGAAICTQTGLADVVTYLDARRALV
ncbi:MAG: DUF2384 domain-containing protein [Maritimibacter sp.]|jgi:hypothetical protein